MICWNMDRSDLKNARLACKELNNAAEIPLFRHIYLRRNMDSFCRLRMIASTPCLAKRVKAIVYSGQKVQGPDECVDYDTWRREYFGKGFEPCLKVGSKALLKTCTGADMHRYYWNWCAHLHSQRLIQTYDIECRDLEYAFSKLPQLEEICFGSDKDGLRIFGPTKREHFCSLGREMMVEPDQFSGSKHHVGQFMAMMAAAHRNKKKLKVIKAMDLKFEAFQQDQEVLAMMIANMRHCEHFAFMAWSPLKRNGGELQIGSMIRDAPHLRKIELIFLTGTDELLEETIDLSRVFLQQCHWSNLASLRLEGFSTSEIHFKEFLAAHATSLTSLKISHVILRPHEIEGKLHHGSWFRMIRFFGESLNLHKMRLHRLLTEEIWVFKDSIVAYGLSNLFGRDDTVFKQRVERYVVDGGDFPLPWPTGTEDDSR